MNPDHKILMVIPTAGGIHEQTAAAAAAMARRPNVAFAIARGRPHDYARNQAVQMMLGGDFTHLFFLDSDVEPPLDAIGRLAAHDAPVVTGFYPINYGHLRWAVCRQRRDDGRWPMLNAGDLPPEPITVAGCGAGCLLIRREVFETLGWPWFKWEHRADGYQLGEDLFFGARCADAGIPILADPAVICRHYKEIDLLSVMEIKN